jgi:hypothetical protein
MSEENRNTIRLWPRAKPELAVATTYYESTQRAIAAQRRRTSKLDPY